MTEACKTKRAKEVCIISYSKFAMVYNSEMGIKSYADNGQQEVAKPPCS